MKTDGGTTEMAGAASPPLAKLIKWAMTAALALFAALCIGELTISLAWLVVGSNGHWRGRATGHALSIGGLLGVLLILTLSATARYSGLARAAAAVVVVALFVLGLSNIPHTLGGMKPSCVLVHWSQTELTPDVLRAVGVDDAGGSLMDLLYSDDNWHHLRLADGRHLEVPRERVAALETCKDWQ